MDDRKNTMRMTSSAKHSGRSLILLAGVNLGAVLGVVYSWSIFVLPLEQAYGWTRAQTSLTYTIMLAAFCLGLLAGGVLLERRGVRFTVLAGAVLLSLGFICAASADTLPRLYLSYGGMAGFGLGIANVVPTSVCMSWFPERRGLIGGLCHMSLPVGTLLYGSVLSSTLIGAMGVGAAFRLLGVLFLGIACLCAMTLRMPPGDVHCPAQGENPGEARIVAQMSASAACRPFTTAEMLRAPDYKYLWLWSLILQTGGWLVAGHVAPYAVEMGVPPELAGLAVGAFALGNGGGKLGLGYGWDKLGRRPSMLAGMFSMFCGMLGLAFLPWLAGGWAVLFFAVMVAVGFGGLFSLMSALLMAFYGPRHYGMNFAVSSTPMLVAAVAGPYLGSLVRLWTGDYRATFLAAAGLSLFGFALIFRIRPPQAASAPLPAASAGRTGALNGMDAADQAADRTSSCSS